MSDLMTIAKAAAESHFFPQIRTPAQALIVLLGGEELGVGNIAALRGLRYIAGNLAVSAGLTATLIRRSESYDYRVAKHDETECALEFINRDTGDVLGESRFTIQDARKAGLAKPGGNYDKWARNMLFARALTNGARWHCPDVFGGAVYTPDELGAFDDGDAEAQPAAEAAPDSSSQNEPGDLGDALVGRFDQSRETQAPDQAGEAAGPPPEPEAPTEAPTPAHIERLHAICERYSLKEAQQTAWCRYFKVAKIEDLTAEQVDRIVNRAHKMFAQPQEDAA